VWAVTCKPFYILFAGWSGDANSIDYKPFAYAEAPPGAILAACYYVLCSGKCQHTPTITVLPAIAESRFLTKCFSAKAYEIGPASVAQRIFSYSFTLTDMPGRMLAAVYGCE